MARRLWGKIPRRATTSLKELLKTSKFSIAAGDILLLDGRWYVSHAGLLRVAIQHKCFGIRVQPVKEFCNPQVGRWAFKATVFKTPNCKGFVGFGDADPSNISSLVRGAEMRVAETRAVNRALRKAYGIGLCSVEEVGSAPPPADTAREPIVKREPKRANGSYCNSNGQPCLRDRLSQLIRQHQLDPALVKLYAADYCGTQELRQASREQIVSFINQLSEQATKDREALICQLNSYGQKQAGAA
jgi:hypothetical protein